MRYPLLALALALFVLVACSKGGDKAKPAGEPTGGSTAPATPGKAEKTVTGSLVIGGALTSTISWKPDLALTCACINAKEWQVDATYSDGADTFVALTVSTVDGATDGLVLTSGKLPTPEPVRSAGSAGISGACKPDNRNSEGVIAVDLDGKLTGKAGEVTVKGHLDVVCRYGL